MKWIFILTLLFLGTVNLSVFAMNVEADPRNIISFMDKSLLPEVDILRITTSISEDNNYLIFQIKTRGEPSESGLDDYYILQILHENNYALFVPINKKREDNILIYKTSLEKDSRIIPEISANFEKVDSIKGFNSKRISRGVELSIPLDWIDFGTDFNFDVYSVQANIQENSLHIHRIYDQAKKGRKEEKKISGITLLNKICTPKR
jgi:hypothetical protein